MNTTTRLLQMLVKELGDAELIELDAIMHAEIGQRDDQTEVLPKIYVIRNGDLYELPSVTSQH